MVTNNGDANTLSGQGTPNPKLVIPNKNLLNPAELSMALAIEQWCNNLTVPSVPTSSNIESTDGTITVTEVGSKTNVEVSDPLILSGIGGEVEIASSGSTVTMHEPAGSTNYADMGYHVTGGTILFGLEINQNGNVPPNDTYVLLELKRSGYTPHGLEFTGTALRLQNYQSTGGGTVSGGTIWGGIGDPNGSADVALTPALNDIFFQFDTSPPTRYYCTATGTPGSWSVWA